LPEKKKAVPHLPAADTSTEREAASKRKVAALSSAVPAASAKGGPSAAATQPPDTKQLRRKEQVKILISGIEKTGGSYAFEVSRIPGASLISDIANASEATHIIICSSDHGPRRTPKLMISLCGSSAKHFLGLEWLERSGKAGAALNASDYEVTTKLYEKGVAVAEKEYAEKGIPFSFLTSISGHNRNKADGVGIFNNATVFFAKGVPGAGLPPAAELTLIVEAGGGVVASTSPTKKSFCENLLVVVPEKKDVASTTSSYSTCANKVVICDKIDFLGMIMAQRPLFERRPMIDSGEAEEEEEEEEEKEEEGVSGKRAPPPTKKRKTEEVAAPAAKSSVAKKPLNKR